MAAEAALGAGKDEAGGEEGLDAGVRDRSLALPQGFFFLGAIMSVEFREQIARDPQHSRVERLQLEDVEWEIEKRRWRREA